LKVKLSRIFKNNFTCTKCLILLLHVNEILIFLRFQFNGALKNTYVLLIFGSYNHNISNF
jgi:hypothetical protein